MKVTKTASRYSQSLIELATEKKVLDEVASDMKSIEGIIKESGEFRTMLKSRVIKAEKKAEVLKAILEGKVHELTLRFAILLSKNGRASLFPEITKDFRERFEIHNRILRMRLISAVALDDDTKAKIKAVIKADDWNDIIFEEVIDPTIIGGYILRTDFIQFDAGVKSQLEEIKNAFLNKTIAA